MSDEHTASGAPAAPQDDVERLGLIKLDLLGLLLWAHGRLRQRGAELVLACPSPATRSLLGKSGLDHVLVVRDHLPAAA